MTREERMDLRMAVDAARRVQERVGATYCRTCQVDYDSYTTGCETCRNRHKHRRTRGIVV